MQSITATQLARRMSEPDPPRLIDILPEESFNRVHLPTAENIPSERLKELAFDRLGREEEIVVYGADVNCRATAQAVAQLEELGYLHVRSLAGGIAQWRREDYELVCQDAGTLLGRR